MEFVNLGSIQVALVMALVLMVSHYLSPLFSRAPGMTERRIASFAGGVSASYVFLHMLPELVEGNEAIGKLLKKSVHLTPLADLGIFAVALLGFTLFYGLELMAVKAGGRDNQAPAGVYRLHLAFYCLTNFLITYTMPLRVQTGLFFAILFTAAMGLHFILTDRNFNRHFRRRFCVGGRLTLVGSLFCGWLVTALTDPVNVTIVGLMIAFLSGSILYNVFKEEIPSDRGSSYGWFTIGLGLTALLLFLAAISGHG